VVAKNGIILFEYYERLYGKLSVAEALVQAGRIRLRPILVATLCTLFGTLTSGPGTCGAELQKLLAIAVIGGLTVSMFASLIIRPVLYSAARSCYRSEPHTSDTT
jgi:multidrug efflux pump subunit AcrB